MLVGASVNKRREGRKLGATMLRGTNKVAIKMASSCRPSETLDVIEEIRVYCIDTRNGALRTTQPHDQYSIPVNTHHCGVHLMRTPCTVLDRICSRRCRVKVIMDVQMSCGRARTALCTAMSHEHAVVKDTMVAVTCTKLCQTSRRGMDRTI